MGDGERMARAVDAGKFRPALVTLGILAVLTTRAAYAFSAAGISGQVPSAKLVISAISVVFLARAFGLPLLKPRFLRNSDTFWLLFSGVCLGIRCLYAAGARQMVCGSARRIRAQGNRRRTRCQLKRLRVTACRNRRSRPATGSMGRCERPAVAFSTSRRCCCGKRPAIPS